MAATGRRAEAVRAHRRDRTSRPDRSPRYDPAGRRDRRASQNLAPGSAPIVKFKLVRPGRARSARARRARARRATRPRTSSPVPRTLHSLASGSSGPSPSPASPSRAVRHRLPPRGRSVGQPGPARAHAPTPPASTSTRSSRRCPATATGTWAVGHRGAPRGGDHALRCRRRDDVPLAVHRRDGDREPRQPARVRGHGDRHLDRRRRPTRPCRGGRSSRRRSASAATAAFESTASSAQQVEYCVICHTPARTDWGASRAEAVRTGTVNLAATYDGIEERSIHFKVMIHRIHTGGRAGRRLARGRSSRSSSTGDGSTFFFDEGLFPNDLANCTVCHEGKTLPRRGRPGRRAADRANETATIRHAAHRGAPRRRAAPSRPSRPRASAATRAAPTHRRTPRRKTVGGVETCAQCHVRRAALGRGRARPRARERGARGGDVLVDRRRRSSCRAARPRPATAASPPADSPRLDAEAGVRRARRRAVRRRRRAWRSSSPYAPGGELPAPQAPRRRGRRRRHRRRRCRSGRRALDAERTSPRSRRGSRTERRMTDRRLAPRARAPPLALAARCSRRRAARAVEGIIFSGSVVRRPVGLPRRATSPRARRRSRFAPAASIKVGARRERRPLLLGEGLHRLPRRRPRARRPRLPAEALVQRAGGPHRGPVRRLLEPRRSRRPTGPARSRSSTTWAGWRTARARR